MSDFTMTDTKRFLLALAGGLLMSFACLTAALAPANAAAPATAARPILL
jgi:pectin methylesterase-like acyl-CoA thioesterase